MTDVSLRPLELSDLEHIMGWINDPEIVGNFGWFGKPVSREEEQRYLERLIAGPDKVYSAFAGGEYLGQVGLHELDGCNKQGRLSIIIGNKDNWGRGYAPQMIDALLDKAFNDLQLHKVWGVFLEQNTKAHHLFVEKCGFLVEGRLRKEYFRRGAYHDMIRIAMLEEEYWARAWEKAEGGDQSVS
ncbi:GNAT family N-acetyltransferase [Candidatus Woesearchaeota archaeon]|nr:GNAT family N-acetyltransferase [Candidatus Woesearchaeota archaeon]